ncbi:MAG: endolytic transglycosylase MltG, partial [Polyangiaceae bacterium]|nr:endolytic transglycosylase MltG [Polyangiaceae bacterium]
MAGLCWLVLVYPERARDGGGREVRFALEAGESMGDLADRLEREGLIDHPMLFAIYMRLLGADERLRQGRVFLRDDLDPQEVARRIATGLGPSRVRVTIPEGFHRFDIARRLAAYGIVDEGEFLRATEDTGLLADLAIRGPSAEGYLFPDTYELAQDSAAGEVIGAMVRNFRRRIEGVVEEHGPALSTLETDLDFALHDVLILASVVEKEAAVDDERPLIAGVFLNRLRSSTFL